MLLRHKNVTLYQVFNTILLKLMIFAYFIDILCKFIQTQDNNPATTSPCNSITVFGLQKFTYDRGVTNK